MIVNDTNLKVNFSTVMDESKILQVNINEFLLSIQPFNISFNGESDMSIVISEYLTFFGNFARSRLISIYKYMDPMSITNLINKVLEQYPDEIDIPLTDLFIQGGLSQDFKIIKNTYIEFPMDISLQNKNFPF